MGKLLYTLMHMIKLKINEQCIEMKAG